MTAPGTRALRVVVADDEPLARDRLRDLLAGHPRFTIVAECESGTQAVDAVLAHAPDLVLLDVRMPGLDGLEVAAALRAQDDAGRAPAVIFVTAYDAHAVRAFALHAVDYLLKPVDADRFAEALARVAARVDAAPTATPPGAPSLPGVADAVRAALAELVPARAYPTRFVVRDARGMYFVRADEIDRVSAEDNYVGLWVQGRMHLLRETMKAIEARLDPSRFVRVHRSAIVNLDRVRRIEPWAHGEYVLTLADGSRLTSSRVHSARLQELLRGGDAAR